MKEGIAKLSAQCLQKNEKKLLTNCSSLVNQKEPWASPQSSL